MLSYILQGSIVVFIIRTINNLIAVGENSEVGSVVRWSEVTLELKSGGHVGAVMQQAEGRAGAKALWWEALVAIQGHGEGQCGFVSEIRLDFRGGHSEEFQFYFLSVR